MRISQAGFFAAGGGSGAGVADGSLGGGGFMGVSRLKPWSGPGIFTISL
jgi:hypothetical protein